ncbi:MAG: chemotaxis protein CheW [Firmicutes bacterium]|nr:chemotaxis protein CheW [Bacillota bacterium]
MVENQRTFGDEIQLVVFLVGKEEYGLEINQVQEINRLLPITRVPRAPSYIEGVINLRGNVIPVINLHSRLGLGTRTNTARTRIIVAQVQEIPVGLIVDEVLGVLYLSSSAIEPPALPGVAASTAHLLGVGKSEGRLILLLDLASLLNLKEHGEEASEAGRG